jgi:hypothetical protein
MPNPILKQAVVVGAGMGDALPDAPAPRPGTPQARHTHGLLAGGRRALAGYQTSCAIGYRGDCSPEIPWQERKSYEKKVC